ncbi:MAG TPA: hypothetical protein VFG08_03315 [Candidatus Polarisedimenticolia bacterium]|nr:hypothetical protein [Candidatus Polarisedimenticolia bacterium]
MEAVEKNCPHCGYALADGATICPCGLSLDDIDVPAPGIVRDSLEQKLTLKRTDDGDLEEIEIEAIVPSSGTPERKKTREGSAWQGEPHAATGPHRTVDRPRAMEDRKDAREVAEPAAHEPSPASGAAREPAPVRPRSADKSPPLRAARDAAGQPRKNLIMACPSCRARISKRAPKCPKCGQSPYRSCQICAALIVVSSAACGECGDPDPFLAQSA